MRFFFASDIAPEGGEQELSGDEAAHLFITLRARPGETVGLLDGRGTGAEAEILPGKKLRIKSRFTRPEPDVRIHLFCAAPRRREWEWLLRQSAEVGAASVNLIVCERSVALPDGGAIGRWNSIVLEGAKQSRNFRPPVIRTAEPLARAVETAAAGNFRSFYGSVAAAPPPQVPAAGDCALFIGPEGGFTPEEEELMRKSGFAPWRFSDLVLRMETAAAGGVLLLNYLAGRR